MAAMSERNRRYHSSSCQVDYSHNPDAKNWRCPNCGHDESEADEEEFEHDTQLNTEANERPVSQQSNISTQDPAVSFESSGAASPSLADGSTTSSRPRRKRKTSPACHFGNVERVLSYTPTRMERTEVLLRNPAARVRPGRFG